MIAETCVCPHCMYEVKRTPNCLCPRCKGGMRLRDFTIRAQEVCALERAYALQDPRKDAQ